MTSASRKSASRKVTLNGTRDIPFNALVWLLNLSGPPHSVNVRARRS